MHAKRFFERKIIRFAAVAATSVLCWQSFALADEATADEATVDEATAESDSDTVLDVVYVTSTKRTEILQDVPQSISLLDEEYLSRLSSDSLADYADFVPGLELQTFAPGRSRITMRGISPDEQTGLTTVSFYLDEIPMTAAGQTAQPEVQLYDIERVELLRGPQGTLYGEGAMGGTIRIITAKPDTEEAGGSFKLSTQTIDGGESGYSLAGMINLPLVKDKLAARIVAETRENPGWIDQRNLTIPDPSLAPPSRYVIASEEEDVNSSTNSWVRAALRYTPTDNLTIDLTYLHDKLDVNSSNQANIDFDTNQNLGLTPSENESDLWNLTGSYDFDGFTLTSASSYTTRDTITKTPQEPVLLGTTDLSTYETVSADETTSFTQEVRAVSNGEGPFRWAVGAYYRNGSYKNDIAATGYVPALMSEIPIFSITNSSDFRTHAVFGEVEYDLTDILTVVAGARWFEEKEEAPGGLERKSDDITPRVTLKVEPSDSFMAYATYSEGYRSGGFNPNAGPTQYEPDTTQNYEIGAKYTRGGLSASGAVYYIDWSDMQFIQLDSGGFFTFVGNASAASSTGAEFDLVYDFDNGIWARIGGNVTDAKLESDVFGNFTGVIPAGRALPAVPEYKLGLSGGYDTTLQSGYTVGVSGGISFVGPQESKLEEGGTYTEPLFGSSYTIGSSIDSYASGRIRAQLGKDNWTAAVYINNIFNEEAAIGNDNYLPTFGQPLYYLQPRTFGVELSSRF
nr:TonB-dependent receptor [uncultured Hyphomonas sp.]